MIIQKKVESKSKEKLSKPSITERKINKNKNINHNIFNYNNQKKIILPLKGNNIRYFQK